MHWVIGGVPTRYTISGSLMDVLMMMMMMIAFLMNLLSRLKDGKKGRSWSREGLAIRTMSADIQGEAENSPQRGTGTYLKADMLYIVETWRSSPEYSAEILRSYLRATLIGRPVPNT